MYQSVKNIIPDDEAFTLDDGERKGRVNLPPRKMMGIDSEGMLISAVHEEDGHEGLNLLMVDDRIPAGAKIKYKISKTMMSDRS